MKRLTFAFLLLATAAVLSSGCAGSKSSSEMAAASDMAAAAAPAASSAASSVASLASDPLISSLTSGLGLNTAQAVGGAGALLGLAQENLAKADWDKIASAIPGAGPIIAQAKSLGGITGKFGSLAALAPAFSKMGLSNDQVASLRPALTDYVGKATTAELGTTLAGAIDE